MNTETLDGLAACPLFEGISREEIIEMMHTVRYRVVNYQKGELILKAGEPCLQAHIVVSGEVSASLMGPSGRTIRITMHHSGNMLAPAFLFAKDNRYPVTVQAMQETQVFRLQSHDLESLIERDPRVAKNYICIVSNIVSFLTKKVGMLSMNVREKLTMFLKEEQERQQTDRIHVPMSRQALADHFGIQKYSLLRCLKEMQKNGSIAVEGKYIRILSSRHLPDF